MVGANGFHPDDLALAPSAIGCVAAPEISPVPEVVRHVTFALSRHVRWLHREGVAVPRDVSELTSLLLQIARPRQNPPPDADERGTRHHAPMLDRLLITKGEVAERLSVSVRTIERLVATGRLPQVYVEHSARFRIKDLEAYVDSLTETQPATSDVESRNGGP